MIAGKTLIKIKKKHRCNNCSSDDNFVSNLEYKLYMDGTTIYDGKERMWFWDGNKGYFTDVIIKKYEGKIITRYAKYEYEIIEDGSS